VHIIKVIVAVDVVRVVAAVAGEVFVDMSFKVFSGIWTAL
jgi:hypothetical protein